MLFADAGGRSTIKLATVKLLGMQADKTAFNPTNKNRSNKTTGEVRLSYSFLSW
jgi:hypothetical protein